MVFYPIIIPTLNRYKHFKECVESLASCTHAAKTELVIGIDYPPSEKYVEGWKSIKDYVSVIKGFKKVVVIEHDHNVGPSGNMEYLRNYVSERYDAWIESEDDNVFSPCFLDYMDRCLEKYSDDKSVLAISGYMYPIDFSSINKDGVNILRTQNFLPYGIGFWKCKVDEMFCNMPEHYVKYVCSHRKLLKKMRYNLRELYRLVFWSKYNPALDTKSDFAYSCYCIINDKYVIAPLVSLTRNMGYDSTGRNCGADDWHSLQLISGKSIFEVKDSPEGMNEAVALWNEKKKSIGFSENERKKVLLYYYMYMFFGYFLAEMLLSNFIFVVRLLRKFFSLIKRTVKKTIGSVYSLKRLILSMYKYRKKTRYPKMLRVLIWGNGLTSNELKKHISTKTFHKVKCVYLDVFFCSHRMNLIDYVDAFVDLFMNLESINFLFRGDVTSRDLSDFYAIKKRYFSKRIKFRLSVYFDGVERLLKLETSLVVLRECCDTLLFFYAINSRNIYNINEVVAFADVHEKKIFYNLDSSDTNFQNDEIAKRLAMEFFYKLFKETCNKKYYSLFLYLRDGQRYCNCPSKTNYLFTFSYNENVSLCDLCSEFDLNCKGEKMLRLEMKKERF